MIDGIVYRKIVGGLQYLCLTRPDIAFAVNKISQYIHSPHDVHWTIVEHMLRYVKGTLDCGLWFHPFTITLIGFLDLIEQVP